MKVVTVSSWLNFGRPAPPGRGSAAVWKFLGPSYYSQRAVFVSLSAFFIYSSVNRSVSEMTYTVSSGTLNSSILLQSTGRFAAWISCVDLTTIVCINLYYASAPRVGALSDDARLTSVCLLRTSGLSREQRSLGRLKLTEVAHITHDSDTTFKVKRSKVNLQELGAYCGGLLHSLF